MKQLITIAFMISVLVACNFKETVKEAGDAIQVGAQNVVEAVKDAPADISEASNNVEADVKNKHNTD